jgi:succinylglutamate desuccinylase
MSRIIDEIGNKERGPLVIFIACTHGNEREGYEALKIVFDKIRTEQIQIKGKVIGLIGNMQAMMANQRYLDYDLNRAWLEENIVKVSNQKGNYLFAEDAELVQLNDLVSQLLNDIGHKLKFVIDLHATSSDLGNFIVVPDRFNNHPIISTLHLPVILSLDQYLKGTFMDYFHRSDTVSLVFEGGLITSLAAVELHESGIWEMLEATGSISRHDHKEVDHYRNKLRKVAESLPKKVQVIHRHWVDNMDEFSMKPGFKNFDAINKGQWLANDRKGKVLAPQSGLIMMPLYQPKGNDGFFIVKEIEK